MSEKPAPYFRPIGAPLDVDDAALDRLNETMGVPTLTRPAAPVAAIETPVIRHAEKLTIELPAYLMDSLRQGAAADRTTVRHLVMTALRASGYAISDADMVPDGRRSRSKSRIS